MTSSSYNIYQQITSVRLCTTVNLNGSYFNGQLNNGVGSTLTALSVGALSVDGVSVNIGDRLLLINQTSTNQNGIYVVNIPGSASTLWVLERSSDLQSPEQLNSGQFFSVGAGNTLAGNMFVIVEPLPSYIGIDSFDFVNVTETGGGGGPFLTVAGNLSDVDNTLASFQNLGLGSGERLSLTDADFAPSGIYTLTNPGPNYIFIAATGAGLELRFPPADGLTSFNLSVGINVTLASFGDVNGVDITDNSGNLIRNIRPLNNYTIVSLDNSSSDGSWFAIPNVLSINSANGLVGLDSTDGSISINNSSNSIDLSVASPGTSSLQDVYNNGPNGDINLSDDRPISIQNVTTASEVNSITTQSTGSNTVANFREEGWTFVPISDMIVTALQYDDALFTEPGTRQTGIFVKSSQELLVSVYISKTDPLDSTNTYRTLVLPDPLNLDSGVEYVFATVMAANETNYTDPDAVGSDINITQSWRGPASSFPFALIYPELVTSIANTVPVGSFQYSTFTVDESINFNDESSDDSVLFEVNSVTRSSHPLPTMSIAERDLIPVPSSGDSIFSSGLSPNRPYFHDGDWNAVAYLSDLPLVPSLGQGQLIIGVDSSDAVAGYLVSSDNSIDVDLSTSGQIDLTLNSAFSEGLQDAYNIGNVIDVASGRPFVVETDTLGAVTDGVTTPSTGLNLNSNYQILGYTFVPTVSILVTSFQVEDSTLAVGQTRTLAIYEKSSGNQLAIGNVSKTDSLVGIYRTNSLTSPVLLSGAVDYVLTAIVPPSQTYRNIADAVAGADISITEFASGDSQAFPIPMSFPTSFTATANVTPYGAFQYQINSVISQFLVQNETSPFFMQAKSVTQATIPCPVMTDAEFSSIASPEQGMMAFASDDARLDVFDGTNYQQFAYVSDIGGGSYGPTVAAVSGANTIVLVKALYAASGTTPGNTVTVAFEFTYTATATTQVFTVDPPINNANFSSGTQATLVGGSIYVNASPAIGDGSLLDLGASVGTGLVQFGILTADTAGTKVASISFMYIIQ